MSEELYLLSYTREPGEEPFCCVVTREEAERCMEEVRMLGRIYVRSEPGRYKMHPVVRCAIGPIADHYEVKNR